VSVDHIWEIRTPGGMMGIEVARGLLAAVPVVLAHSLPPKVSVTVRDEGGAVVARGSDLEADGDTPMARLTLADRRVTRRQVWPGESDLGLPVILPGGEVGILCQWWNAPDGHEWRWRVEFHNSKG
jgi:type IV secretory pathway VirJ component